MIDRMIHSTERLSFSRRLIKSDPFFLDLNEEPKMFPSPEITTSNNTEAKNEHASGEEHVQKKEGTSNTSTGSLHPETLKKALNLPVIRLNGIFKFYLMSQPLSQPRTVQSPNLVPTSHSKPIKLNQIQPLASF